MQAEMKLAELAAVVPSADADNPFARRGAYRRSHGPAYGCFIHAIDHYFVSVIRLGMKLRNNLSA